MSYYFHCSGPSTTAWLTAVATLPATTKYPPIVTITLGNAIGAAIIVPPAAANTKPTMRSFLKNFGVGDEYRSAILISLEFVLFLIVVFASYVTSIAASAL